MFYSKNVPVFERYLRLAFGAALALLGYWFGEGPLMASLLVGSGLILALTGFLGFCPACAMVGRKLEKAKQGA